MRFEVLFPNGETYQIGGMPLCDEEKLQKICPSLVEALKLEGDENIGKQVFEIVKFFNPNVEEETFIFDVYTATEVFRIWNGEKLEEQKKT